MSHFKAKMRQIRFLAASVRLSLHPFIRLSVCISDWVWHYPHLHLCSGSLPAHVPQVLINREPLRHLNFDVELLGDCDVIVNQLCHHLGGHFSELCSTGSPATEVTTHDVTFLDPLASTQRRSCSPVGDRTASSLAGPNVLRVTSSSPKPISSPVAGDSESTMAEVPATSSPPNSTPRDITSTDDEVRSVRSPTEGGVAEDVGIGPEVAGDGLGADIKCSESSREEMPKIAPVNWSSLLKRMLYATVCIILHLHVLHHP